MTRLAGVELGGTKIIAVVAEDERIVERERWPTTRPDEVLPAVNSWLRERHAEAPLAALGIASFGPIRLDPAASDHGQLLVTPKPGWQGADVRRLGDGLGIPLALDTDVNAAALAEWRWGAGQGAGSLVYLTIGTGIGGGVLIEGRPVHGALHPEIGHMRFRRAPGDTFAGACPVHGDCVEGLVSGTAIRARLGVDPATLKPEDERLDPVARDLAELFAGLLLALAPQRILVGGGVGIGLPWLIEAACESVPDILAGYLPDLADTASVKAIIGQPSLGPDAGPMGAIALAETALR
jgi:fructokinase